MSRLFAPPRRRWVALLGLALVAPSCQTPGPKRGAWPPADFYLDVEYAVITAGRRQVRQRAQFYADGLVVYREADASLRPEGGAPELPVFRRLCAYKMTWWSIRDLARDLHAAKVREVGVPSPAPPIDGRDHVLRFDLTYMANHIEVVAQNQVVGLLNLAMRIVNSRLPPGHAIRFPEMVGEKLEPCLQDVPQVTDSIAGALRFHEEWLREHATSAVILRDTFALACAARDWRLAENCVTRLAVARPGDAAALRRVLGMERGDPPDPAAAGSDR